MSDDDDYEYKIHRPMMKQNINYPKLNKNYISKPNQSNIDIKKFYDDLDKFYDKLEKDKEHDRLIEIKKDMDMKKDKIKIWYKKNKGISKLLPLDINLAYDKILKENEKENEKEQLKIREIERLNKIKIKKKHMQKIRKETQSKKIEQLKIKEKQLTEKKQIIKELKEKQSRIIEKEKKDKQLKKNKELVEIEKPPIYIPNLERKTRPIIRDNNIYITKESELIKKIKRLTNEYKKKKKMYNYNRKKPTQIILKSKSAKHKILRDRYGNKPYKKNKGKKERAIEKDRKAKALLKIKLKKEKREKYEDNMLAKDYMNIICLKIQLDVKYVDDIPDKEIVNDFKKMVKYIKDNSLNIQNANWDIVNKLYKHFYY